MKITVEYLRAEIDKMIAQRDHAHDVAVASQAAIDVLSQLVNRVEQPEPETITLSEEAESVSV